MSTAPGSERPTRARVVADAPVEGLLARSEELARRWAIALILARPLAELGAIPLEQLAHVAPALCGELSRALASDEELERLARGDAGRTAAAALPFEREPRAVVSDFDALRSILWEATLAELRDPPPRLVADLADRLSHVCAVALAATLDARGEDATAPHAASPPSPPPGRARVLYGTRRASAHAGAVLIDEAEQEPRPLAALDEAEDALDAPVSGADANAEAAASHAPPGSPGPASEPARTTPRARPWDTPLGDEPTMRVRRGPGAPVDERR